MRNLPVKNTIGPYSFICSEVAKVGPIELLGWLRSHDPKILGELTVHVITCYRCREIHAQAVRLVPPIPPEECPTLHFDAKTCAEVAKHRTDLIDWMYRIRGEEEELFLDALYHLGLCGNCPMTDEELEEIALIGPFGL